MTDKPELCPKCNKPIYDHDCNMELLTATKMIITHDVSHCHARITYTRKAPPQNELDKWSNIHEEFIQLEEFITFVQEERINLCEQIAADDSGSYWQQLTTQERVKLFYKFHDIDPVKLEQERRQLLKEVAPK